MTTKQILNSLGKFLNFDAELFEKHSSKRTLNNNEVLLNEGEVCKSFYFVKLDGIRLFNDDHS